MSAHSSSKCCNAYSTEVGGGEDVVSGVERGGGAGGAVPGRGDGPFLGVTTRKGERGFGVSCCVFRFLLEKKGGSTSVEGSGEAGVGEGVSACVGGGGGDVCPVGEVGAEWNR